MFKLSNWTDKATELSPVHGWKTVKKDLSVNEAKWYGDSTFWKGFLCVAHPYLSKRGPLFGSETMRETLWWYCRSLVSEMRCSVASEDRRAHCWHCQHKETCDLIEAGTSSPTAEADTEIYVKIFERKILWITLPLMKAGAAFFLSPMSREKEDQLSFLNDHVDCEEYEEKKCDK